MKRTRVAQLIVVTVVLASGAGWVAGTRIRSPAEVAARTAPPEPSPILVPAKVQELSTDVVTRGVGRFGSPVAVSLAPTVLKTGSQIVTMTPTIGEEVIEGAVVMAVSERPVRVLEGVVPMYRDLGPGMSGRDVRQLEAALSRLGFDPGSIDGVFDASTESAVATWYRADGFDEIVTPAGYADQATSAQVSLIPGSVAGSGVQVPADEVVFLPELPVRISEVLTVVGERVEGHVMTVTDTAVAVDGSVPIESASLVNTGMMVAIDEPDLGISAEGTVSFVAAGPGTNGVDGYHIYFEVLVPWAPPGLVNASVRLTIPTRSTGGPVLTVPISAMSMAPDGSSRVRRQHGESLEYVTVEPGFSAKGYVLVTPVSGELRPGDLVVVGFENPSP